MRMILRSLEGPIEIATGGSSIAEGASFSVQCGARLYGLGCGELTSFFATPSNRQR